jgi:hypothetical protein
LGQIGKIMVLTATANPSLFANCGAAVPEFYLREILFLYFGHL